MEDKAKSANISQIIEHSVSQANKFGLFSIGIGDLLKGLWQGNDQVRPMA